MEVILRVHPKTSCFHAEEQEIRKLREQLAAQDEQVRRMLAVVYCACDANSQLIRVVIHIGARVCTAARKLKGDAPRLQSQSNRRY